MSSSKSILFSSKIISFLSINMILLDTNCVKAFFNYYEKIRLKKLKQTCACKTKTHAKIYWKIIAHKVIFSEFIKQRV